MFHLYETALHHRTVSHFVCFLCWIATETFSDKFSLQKRAGNSHTSDSKYRLFSKKDLKTFAQNIIISLRNTRGLFEL